MCGIPVGDGAVRTLTSMKPLYQQAHFLYNGSTAMTLTQTAALARRSIVGGVIFFILVVAGFIGYRIWYAYQLANTPPVEEKPTLKFGTLPAPEFPKAKVSPSGFTYSLDTVTGGLPTFERLVKVYFIPKAHTTFLSADRSKALAEKLGIETNPTTISETRYTFSDGGKTLIIELDSGNFSYTGEASPSATVTQDQKRIVTDFKNFLSNLGLSKKELVSGPSKINLISGDLPTAQISIWPEKIDDKEILTSDRNKALVNATVIGPANSIDSYTLLNFTFWPVDTTTFATYPLKNTQKAFEDLKVGKGVIIVEPGKPQVSITSVSLAYYQQNTYTQYLQPIFVFEGQGFVAYTTAIADEYISQTK